jgi:hypothetical protein
VSCDARAALVAGSFYSLPSEANKYTHVFVAWPVEQSGLARLDAEIEKYFDISAVSFRSWRRWTAGTIIHQQWRPSLR